MQLEPYAIYVYNRKNIATETTEAPTNPLLETLTKREKEVLELIGQVVLTVQAQGSNQEPPTPTTSDIEALKKRIDDLYFFIKKKHN